MTVSISEGLHLTDRDALRFARHMLNELDGYGQRAKKAIMSEVDGKGASLGNRIGQQRAFSRIAKAMGPTFLNGALGTGKKGKFVFHYSTFSKAEGDLFILHVSMHGRQLPKDDAVSAKELMRFTGHSLQRLIQRAGVREADDYVPILRALAGPSLILAATAQGSIPYQWPLPVTVNGQRIILLVKTPIEDPVPTAITVYPGEWRESPVMDVLADRLVAFDPLKFRDGDTDWFRFAFTEAARSLTERKA